MEEGVTIALIGTPGRGCFANATCQKDFRESLGEKTLAASFELAMA